LFLKKTKQIQARFKGTVAAFTATVISVVDIFINASLHGGGDES